MGNGPNVERRRFLGGAAMALVASQFGLLGDAGVTLAGAAPAEPTSSPTPQADKSLGPIKQVDAGDLSAGYAVAGPSDGPAVLLLHGWPYDIHSYADVAPLLASKGYRVIIPHLRGFAGATS